jgi:hypothetical protein
MEQTAALEEPGVKPMVIIPDPPLPKAQKEVIIPAIPDHITLPKAQKEEGAGFVFS